ncbi:MAG: transporter permease, partial [Devosia sp.]|nr:transporter permease [Devosia sp.]
ELGLAVPTQAGLPEFLQDDKNLLLYRAVAYSLFPLLLALLDVRQRGVRLTRQLLRPSFYSQSYIAAPFVLSFDIAVLVGRHGSAAAVSLGVALFALGLAWYCGAQIAWFTTVRGVNAGRAVAMVLGTVLAGFVAVLVVLVATAATAIFIS